ncbi:smad nuclear-interacting protein 1-like [Oncorhynchus keta]|uniref:smad nuclear-interacting protein 1-like n=1 Tax=Oncorhynchus keta TaxID=8018 RepID=UPI0015FDDD9B|nr:smad nuclear-interacting protein 1-like [Oncorhynchus keta]
MDKERRHKRVKSPVRHSKPKIKQEKLSPARPQRSRHSSSGSNGSPSPPPQRRRTSRSPPRTKGHSPGRRALGRRDRSPKNTGRSRSPPRSADVRIKREQDDHRGADDRRRRDRNDKPEPSEPPVRRSRWEQADGPRESDRPRERKRVERERGGGGDRPRERESRSFQEQQAERQQHDNQRRDNRHRFEENNGEGQAFGQGTQEGGEGKDSPPVDKEKPNFELSGALTEDTNTFRGEVIKYNEPPEARIPKRRWRLYPFKNDEQLPVMYVHRQSAYLMGRQRKIADIPIDHPSCSKQHAVFQYRLVEFTRSDGTGGRRVKPYIIDLGSGNGTYLNNQRIEAQRYYELKEKDVLKFGFSSREYVLLHEFSDTAEVDARAEEDDEGLDEGLDEEMQDL